MSELPSKGFFNREPTMQPSSAVISDDGRYRYALRRHWSPYGSNMLVIMLNPSTADATVDDPTIKKVCGFGKRLGHASVSVGNLFAYRATNPRDLATVGPRVVVGPENDKYLAELVHNQRDHDAILCAWGRLPNWAKGREKRVLDMLRESGQRLYCLGTNKDGSPKHPLYVSYQDAPMRFDAAA